MVNGLAKLFSIVRCFYSTVVINNTANYVVIIGDLLVVWIMTTVSALGKRCWLGGRKGIRPVKK